MRIINVHEAKTHFSQLLDAAAAGEEIVIAKAGKPFVRLTAIVEVPRKPGAAKNKGRVTKKFFTALSEEELQQWR
jgi:prevent-host-death family protein